MSKIVVIRHTDDIDLYFSKLNEIFADFPADFIFIPDSKLDQLEKYNKGHESLYLIEYVDEDFFNRTVSKLYLLEDSKLYLVLNRDIISIDGNENLKSISMQDKISGFIDVSLPVEFYIPFFKELFNNMDNGSKIVKLKDMGKQLEGLVGNTLAELQRVKNIHEQVVPMRNEKIKGVEILSKYSAGEKAGGDFFDVLSSKNEFTLLLTSSTSYVISSVVLAHFEVLKEKGSIDEESIQNFISCVEAELNELGFGNDFKDIQLFIVKYDLKRFKASGYAFGKFELISNLGRGFIGNDYPVKKAFMDKSRIDIPFKRGEKMILLSPGIRYNLVEMSKEQDLSSFLKENLSKTGKELLNELFFRLHKDRNSEFLEFDASAIYLEVSKNAIFQV